MSLSSGVRLGPYEILGAIGAGGMGEVYRARDTRLGRDVAVKVLPAELSHDRDRLHRFEQEARLAGSLNHPGVLTVYDVGSHEGAPYLVTELLEGRSLREALTSGPLPTRKAIEHAQQIAHGLAAAHAEGIVHRDLKPANAFVTKDGRVKILDFGLAKLTQLDLRPLEDSAVSTKTAEGRIVGTVGYMAPEQVRGQAVDARSDIFAFGAVLYEMLTGERAFRGETTADTLTAILTKDPGQMSRPDRPVPPGLDRLVRRCLEKSPEERFQSARDVAFALEAESGSSQPGVEVATVTARSRRRWLATTAVGLSLLLLLAGIGIGLLSGRRLWDRPLPKITQLTFRRGAVDNARFTPDGQTVVYSAFWDGQPPEIFTTRVESPESRFVGLPPARLMSVSSTSELAILLTAPGDLSDVSTGTLARAPLSGGEPRRLLDDVVAADWSPDGRELAVVRRVEGEFQLEYPIGKVLARPVHTLGVRVSPGGDRVANCDGGGITVYDTAGRATRVQTPRTVYGHAWTSDDTLWFAAGETWRWKSVWRGKLTGHPREVYRPTGEVLLQDASSDGRLLLHHGAERVGVRAKGPGEDSERELGVFSWSWAVDLSADGSQALIGEADSAGSPAALTYIRPMHGGPPVRLSEGTPLALSPKGTWVLIASPDPRPRFVVTPTGPGEPRTLPSDWFDRIESPWFLDERRLLIHASSGEGRARGLLVDLSGGEPRPVTPEGIVSVRGSYRDGAVIGVAPDGALTRYPLQDGTPQPLAARLPTGAAALRLSGDGRFVFVGHSGMPYRVERLDLATGRVTAWKTLQPDDLTGASHILGASLTPDGEAYAYTYGRYFQDLYLVEGLGF
jgi:tRNA A-37 threonylcarbamoyl transferase component Bud32